MKHYIYGLYKKNIEYSINSLSENLFYIGISSGDKNLYYREKNHRSCLYNRHKLSIIKKYDFYLRIFWCVDTREEAEDREEFLIRCFGNILTNICKSSKDLTYARSKPKKPKHLWKKHSEEVKIANRNRNLTVPYEDIINIIQEWKQNPLETQQDFANRKGISRSKFKDWLRLYDPECIGLTKKIKREAFDAVYCDGEKPKETIQKLINKLNCNYSEAKSLYYRFIKCKQY